MTDAQFGTLLSVVTAGLAGIVAIIRWSVGRLTRALDSNTDAHMASVRAMTAMSTKLDFVYNASRDVHEYVTEERSGVHDVPPEFRRQALTPRAVPVRRKTGPVAVRSPDDESDER